MTEKRIKYLCVWEQRKCKDIFDRVSKAVDVEAGEVYREIGIRSHGKGLFYKDEITGEGLGNKRVFWVEPNSFILNIVFAWERAVTKTTEKELGMIASHRFPMYKPKENVADLDYITKFFITHKGKYILEMASPGGAGRNKTLGQKEFENSTICLPSYEEQKKIGRYLEVFDHLITLHQRIIYKFSEKLTFTWEQRKLGDIAEFSKGSGYSKGDLIESGTPIILYGRLYTKYETSISEVDTYVEAKDGSVYSKGGEVIVPASGETAEDIARAATVDKSGVILGGDLNVVSPNEDINSAFLAISISHGNSQRELAKKAQGKSVVHIHNEEIKNLVVPFPAKAEQNKIVEYFSNIDDLITLHQRNPCNLNKFMAFDWEQRKLGEVAQEFKSGNFLKADEIDIAGDYPVYGGNGLRGYTSTYNHDGEFALIGRQGALCGNMNYSVGKAYFTEHAVVVEADENNDTRFLYCMLDIMNLGQYSDQSAQPGLAVNKLIKLENFFPQKEEQQRDCK